MHDSIEAHSSWYVRYVDDTFIVVPSEQSALRLLKALNNAHPSLHFTHELEKQGVLPFLDVSVIRNSDGRFSTTVYRKPTFSGVFLNFNSFSPISYGRIKQALFEPSSIVPTVFAPLNFFQTNFPFSAIFLSTMLILSILSASIKHHPKRNFPLWRKCLCIFVCLFTVTLLLPDCIRDCQQLSLKCFTQPSQ